MISISKVFISSTALNNIPHFLIWVGWKGKRTLEDETNSVNFPSIEKFNDQLRERIEEFHKQIDESHKREIIQEEQIDNVFSLKTPEILVDVKGHPRRTLELRCGFALPTEDPILITLIKKDVEKKSYKEEEGEPYLCKLRNGTECYVIIWYEKEENTVRWYAKSFSPKNREEWFEHCNSHDMLLKDDEILNSIDRIEWHDKLVEKIERKRKNNI